MMQSMMTQMPSSALPKHPQKLLRRVFLLIIFIGALGLSLLTNHNTGIARVGWMLLTALFMLGNEYQINAIFFFAAFFLPARIAPDLFFTLKHFHIAVGLSLVIQFIKGGIGRTLSKNLFLAKPLWPLGAFIAIAAASALRNGIQPPAVKLTGNLCLVLACVIFLLALTWNYKGKISRPLAFFICGLILQILYGFSRDFFFPNPLNQKILHNNHLGIISSILFFYCLPMGITQPRIANRFLAYAGCLILLCATIFSCSRTAWISTLFGLCIFIGTLLQSSPHHSLRGRTKKIGLSLVGLLTVSLTALFLFDNAVHFRLIELADLFKLHTWQYTLQDRQNFGFLGIFRLNMLHELAGILRQHPLFGIGLTHDIIGFHGLYFVILGSSGIVGFLFFTYFFFQLIRNLLKKMRAESCSRNFGFHAGTVAALSVWYLSSFMETLFVQFAVWIPVAVAILLSEKRPHEAPLV